MQSILSFCQDLIDSGRLDIFHATPLTEQLEDIFNNQIDTSEADAMLDDFFNMSG